MLRMLWDRSMIRAVDASAALAVAAFALLLAFVVSAAALPLLLLLRLRRGFSRALFLARTG